MPDCNGELSNFLRFLAAVALTGVPGILGGLTKAVSPYLSPEGAAGKAVADRPHSWRVYFANAVTGFGGAMSAVLVTIWAKRFPSFPLDVEAFLLLFTMGYIAGNSGFVVGSGRGRGHVWQNIWHAGSRVVRGDIGHPESLAGGVC